jgi:hypothetical protein
MSIVAIRRLLPCLTALVLFALMAMLWLSGHTTVYYQAIRWWGVTPGRAPFLDTETVMSAVRCLRQGVDVYVTNPCDPLARPFDYSPLWMVLAVLPVTPAWLPWIGLVVAALFFAALSLLPAGHDRRAALVITAGAISSATWFAVERGNNDLVLFALAAAAAALLARADSPSAGTSRARAALYAWALIVLAGLLKYYPMAAMMLALRERLPRFFTVAAASLTITVLFAVLTWHDLSRALSIIPVGWPFGGMYGASNLARGIAHYTGGGMPLVHALTWPLTAVALAAAALLARRPDSQAALAALTPTERMFLLIGAIFTAAAFMTAQNIGYRVIHILLTLPALSVLMRQGQTRRLRWLVWVALELMWDEVIRRRLLWAGVLAAGDTGRDLAFFGHFALREAAWWWLVVQYLSLVFAWALASPALAQLHAHLPATLRRAIPAHQPNR